MLFVHESVIAAPPERVFAFHAQPDALRKLLPPWETAEVVTPPSSLAPGTRVLIRLRAAPGVWLEWEAEHTRYERDVLFADRQLRGPFRRWVHTHRFLPHAQGTLLRDEVDLALPLAPLSLPAWPLVRRRLRRMFEWRHEVTRRECVP
jgi:ligand-binding SRPBCC domain-containing protein